MANPWDGWELWFIASLALMVIPPIIALIFWPRGAEGTGGDDCGKTKIVIFSILDLTVVAIAYLHYYFKMDILILPIVGAASFTIPLVLSFCDEYNLGTRLDNGEVRKSIAISFTVIYLILLSLIFFNVTLSPVSGNNSSSEVVKLSISVNATNNGPEAQIASDAGSTDDATAGSEDSQNDTVITLGQIPSYAVKDLPTNFLYVYIIIIGFYFGSRVFEDFAGAKMAKELKDVKPVDILKKRYAMGEISHEDYLERIVKLNNPCEIDIAFSKDKKTIRITNLGEQADAGVIKMLVINGIVAAGTNKDGKPLEGTEIPKGETDILIETGTINKLGEKKSYTIRLITDTGRDVKREVTLTDF